MSESQQQTVTPTAAPALAIRGLSKLYGEKVAAADINLDIPAGSFYGIVGPNGAGKTTTLSMATGMLVPDRGTAFVHGIDVWQDPRSAKAHLGILPDGLRVFDRLSGFELVAYAGMLHGLSDADARDRAHDLMRALGLAEDQNKLVADYSAGMTKKAILATALVHSPSVLVLDEPFESVDPISTRTIRTILDNFRNRGGTVVLSSHVMDTVQRLCTHVAIFAAGRVVAAGTTDQVAAGQDLDDRFAQLVGGDSKVEGLEWL